MKIAILLITLICSACSTTPDEIINHSGQWQTVAYDSTDQANVVLQMSSSGSVCDGTGNFNGINFRFGGTIIQSHMVIAFDLLNTSAGDLKDNIIDVYFSSDGQTAAGGYTLQGRGTEKIRFRLAAGV